MAKQQKIRIKLKSYDHNLVDYACNKIVETGKKTIRTAWDLPVLFICYKKLKN